MRMFGLWCPDRIQRRQIINRSSVKRLETELAAITRTSLGASITCKRKSFRPGEARLMRAHRRWLSK